MTTTSCATEILERHSDSRGLQPACGMECLTDLSETPISQTMHVIRSLIQGGRTFSPSHFQVRCVAGFDKHKPTLFQSTYEAKKVQVEHHPTTKQSNRPPVVRNIGSALQLLSSSRILTPSSVSDPSTRISFEHSYRSRFSLNVNLLKAYPLFE
jgi:hypothetical protein